MKILIVEDDSFKIEDLKEHIKNKISNCIITVKKSYQSACDAALSDYFDLLLLDMSIPTFDITNNEKGGDTLKNGGELIMRELTEEGIPFEAVIISQYETFNQETVEQIDTRLENQFGPHYHGWIKYSTRNNDWQEKLTKIIENDININN